VGNRAGQKGAALSVPGKESMKKGLFCFYHWDRAKKKVPATNSWGGTPVCDSCFRGRPVLESELIGDNEGRGHGSGAQFHIPATLETEIRRRLALGERAVDVAAQCGVAASTVYRVKGWRRRGTAHRSHRLTTEEQKEIERELVAGTSPRELAKKFNTDRSTIYWYKNGGKRYVKQAAA
jgi:DNA-binding CsgD family transcriptional regulator